MGRTSLSCSTGRPRGRVSSRAACIRWLGWWRSWGTSWRCLCSDGRSRRSLTCWRTRSPQYGLSMPTRAIWPTPTVRRRPWRWCGSRMSRSSIWCLADSPVVLRAPDRRVTVVADNRVDLLPEYTFECRPSAAQPARRVLGREHRAEGGVRGSRRYYGTRSGRADRDPHRRRIPVLRALRAPMGGPGRRARHVWPADLDREGQAVRHRCCRGHVPGQAA